MILVAPYKRHSAVQRSTVDTTCLNVNDFPDSGRRRPYHRCFGKSLKFAYRIVPNLPDSNDARFDTDNELEDMSDSDSSKTERFVSNLPPGSSLVRSMIRYQSRADTFSSVLSVFFLSLSRTAVSYHR